jgi:hypothetical protein
MGTSSVKLDSANLTRFKGWGVELLFAVPIVALVITLFYTWFAVRDRYLIFLYDHVMGPAFDTTPFGWVTVGRYWMCGLVASGAVMVPYMAINFVLGRVVGAYRAPEWWRLWILCAIPLLIAVPVIVMTVNSPVLPPLNAAQVTTATLIGLAFAMMLGRVAAERPLRYILLMVDAVALACLLMSIRAAESYPRWHAGGKTALIYRFLAVLAIGVGLVVVMTVVYTWWRRACVPDVASWIVAGMSIHYLLLPLYHHLCWCKDDGSWTDPDYFAYVPSTDNYFSRNVLFQIGVWVTVVLVVLGVTRMRLRLSNGRTAALSRYHRTGRPSA